MVRRLPKGEQLRHKVMVALNGTTYEKLLAEAERQDRPISTTARLLLERVLAAEPQAPEPEAPKRAYTWTERKQRQVEHDALCLPYLRAASGPADAIARLEAAGIPSPSTKTPWGKVAVWRICKRHGVTYNDPNG